MKINANSIRPGNVLSHNGKLWVVAKIMHTQPGKGGAFIQVEMKDIKDGIKLNERFRSSEDVERAHLDEADYQYLFTEGDFIYVMDTNSYEQLPIRKDSVGEPIVFLTDGMMLKVVSYENQVIGVELPEEVVLEVAETEAVIKGQTASSSYKPALMTNGVRVMVPPFISAGDKLVVKTADSSYVERAK